MKNYQTHLIGKEFMNVIGSKGLFNSENQDNSNFNPKYSIDYSQASLNPCLVLKYRNDELVYVYANRAGEQWIEYTPKGLENMMELFTGQLAYLEPINVDENDSCDCFLFNIIDREGFIAHNIKNIVLPSKNVQGYFHMQTLFMVLLSLNWLIELLSATLFFTSDFGKQTQSLI